MSIQLRVAQISRRPLLPADGACQQRGFTTRSARSHGAVRSSRRRAASASLLRAAALLLLLSLLQALGQRQAAAIPILIATAKKVNHVTPWGSQAGRVGGCLLASCCCCC